MKITWKNLNKKKSIFWIHSKKKPLKFQKNQLIKKLIKLDKIIRKENQKTHNFSLIK